MDGLERLAGLKLWTSQVQGSRWHCQGRCRESASLSGRWVGALEALLMMEGFVGSLVPFSYWCSELPFLSFFLYFFVFLPFLGPLLLHMEVPRLGV